MRKTKVLHNMRFMGSKIQQIKQTVKSKNKSELYPYHQDLQTTFQPYV